MERIDYSKWAVWIVISVLAVHVIAQPGFLSIDCGGKKDHTDENNITWVTDSKYINTGETNSTGSATLPSYLQRVRYFPKPLNNSCYQLPVTPNVHYLVRLWFTFGNYSRFDKYPLFSVTIETLDMFYSKRLTELDGMQDPFIHEGIYVSSGKVLYICLIRFVDSDDPFINAIELRALQNGMYGQAKPGIMLILNSRNDVATNSKIRYPVDNFDRIWKPYYIDDSSRVRSVRSQEPISSNDTKNFPPSPVMQTAWVMNVDDYEFSLSTDSLRRSLLLLYFAEIETLNTSRSFYVTINGEIRSGTITMIRNYSTLQLPFISNETAHFSFHLVKATDSASRPIINAFEYYSVYDTEQPTNSQDIEALQAIKKRFDIKNWISDPCFGLPWQGIHCNRSASPYRISEINFSGRNLSGSVPEDIGRLNALINLTLDNNQLSGPLPNFSSLTMLERLHVQNNSLRGSVPDWLSELKNLKELFIENNNFSGVIPTQLLNNPSLKINYSGNRYLCMHKGECVVHNPRKEEVSVVLIITICGALVIALALMVAIAVYRKKFRTKRRFKEDCSMVMVLNPTKSRAFTWEEMVNATQNFNRKIGQGGFGSVFFGTLPEGNDVAVKVLSLFSKEGIHQFENEVDLLSRTHHKNLVSLIGYCHESRELMLIYEYMPGGSLRDSLYGRNTEISQLDWKTRLKISLDAAQGLEYLHVGCNPKIIHRDVKTANILLDSNMNGKLADFGLSKMTADGEASHVTTMVKGTPGYLDPDYFRTQMLTEKSDVYSFGVVLLEIICGRPPINASLPEEQLNIVQWVTPYVEMDENGGEIAEIIDKRLGGNYDIKSIACIAKLAMRCVDARPSYRPSASEVVANIKEAIICEINIQHGDFQGGAVCSRVDDMEWEDNSSNLFQMGR